MSGALTFRELRAVNSARALRWHPGARPPLAFVACELAGEVGELAAEVLTVNQTGLGDRGVAELAAKAGALCNVIKKQARRDMGMAGGIDETEAKLRAASEIGDVLICLDLLAWRLGLSLEKCVAQKFNATSEKHGFPDRLEIGE
jgi:hypothetical protein